MLRAVGTLLAGATRERSAAFRYGGEEFLLLLHDTGPQAALVRAEEIRARIEALRLAHDGRELGSITASIGLASTPDDCAADRLVHAADAALLRAKAQGRNRVEAAQRRGHSAAA